MSLFLLDTDTVSLLERGHAAVLQHINTHPVADIVLSTVTIQEQMHGFQAALSRARTHQQVAVAHAMLAHRLIPAWGAFPILPLDEAALLRFEQLRAMRLNVGLMDLRIAAIALENKLTVVTRNLRDFGRVPGLASVDWSI